MWVIFVVIVGIGVMGKVCVNGGMIMGEGKPKACPCPAQLPLICKLKN